VTTSDTVSDVERRDDVLFQPLVLGRRENGR
jgi:hypothetical protein